MSTLLLYIAIAQNEATLKTRVIVKRTTQDMVNAIYDTFKKEEEKIHAVTEYHEISLGMSKTDSASVIYTRSLSQFMQYHLKGL